MKTMLAAMAMLSAALPGIAHAGRQGEGIPGRQENLLRSVDRAPQATITFKIIRIKADGELLGEIQKVVLTDLGAQKLWVV